jgi:GrpB-like predicted nucleotidyltransferase (UPF0157 family)
MGWSGVKNGELLKAAEDSGIDVLLTGDQTLNLEQNLAGRRLAIVALSAIQLPIVKKGLSSILEAIDRATPGSFAIADCGSFSRKRPATIGLDRGTVRVEPHDPAWFAAADRVCRDVLSHCGELVADIQHVGSTSVPGLPAKPVLDIAAGVPADCAIDDLLRALSGAGFQYRGDKGDTGGHLFVVEPAPNVRTVHLHIVEHGSAQWRDYLLFRDILRTVPSLREQYAELKRQLATAHSEDRTAYTSGKAAFIRTVLEGREPVEEEPPGGNGR